MTIREAQDKVNAWIEKYGVRYFSELTNLAILMEEVGELAKLFARQYGDQSTKSGEKINEISKSVLAARTHVFADEDMCLWATYWIHPENNKGD